MSWPPTIKELRTKIDAAVESLKELDYPEPYDKQGTVYNKVYLTSTGRRMSVTISDYDEYLRNKPEDPWYGQY